MEPTLIGEGAMGCRSGGIGAVQIDMQRFAQGIANGMNELHGIEACQQSDQWNLARRKCASQAGTESSAHSY